MKRVKINSVFDKASHFGEWYHYFKRYYFIIHKTEFDYTNQKQKAFLKFKKGIYANKAAKEIA